MRPEQEDRVVKAYEAMAAALTSMAQQQTELAKQLAPFLDATKPLIEVLSKNADLIAEELERDAEVIRQRKAMQEFQDTLAKACATPCVQEDLDIDDKDDI